MKPSGHTNTILESWWPCLSFSQHLICFQKLQLWRLFFCLIFRFLLQFFSSTFPYILCTFQILSGYFLGTVPYFFLCFFPVFSRYFTSAWLVLSLYFPCNFVFLVILKCILFFLVRSCYFSGTFLILYLTFQYIMGTSLVPCRYFPSTFSVLYFYFYGLLQYFYSTFVVLFQYPWLFTMARR